MKTATLFNRAWTPWQKAASLVPDMTLSKCLLAVFMLACVVHSGNVAADVGGQEVVEEKTHQVIGVQPVERQPYLLDIEQLLPSEGQDHHAEQVREEG